MKVYDLYLDDAHVYAGTYHDVLDYIENNARVMGTGALHARARVQALPDTRCATLRTLIHRAPKDVQVTFGKRVPTGHTLTRR